MKKLLSLLIVLLIAALPVVAQTTWKIDPVHSKVLFTVSHMVVSEVTGRFNEFDATLVQTNDDFSESKLSATIKTNSIDTDNEKRDEHLKSADFFDAEKYPEITFESKSFVKTGENKYTITGNLTMHGITKEVVLDATMNGIVKSPWGNEVAGFKAETTVNRYDFGLKWNKALEAGGVIVGENVKVTLQVELVKQGKKES
jgi:polyisoprenoid-binding protein YceI